MPACEDSTRQLRKNGIVDVRCKNKVGRQFLVEMQMILGYNSAERKEIGERISVQPLLF